MSKGKKTCCVCHRQKGLAAFNRNKTRRDGYQSSCRKCQREHFLAWRETKGRAFHARRAQGWKDARKERARSELMAYFQGRSCMDCGNTDFRVLDFDHVRGKKDRGVCAMINAGCKWSSILNEIAKCEIVCCNCHRLRTARQFGWWRVDENEQRSVGRAPQAADCNPVQAG